MDEDFLPPRLVPPGPVTAAGAENLRVNISRGQTKPKRKLSEQIARSKHDSDRINKFPRLSRGPGGPGPPAA